MSLLSAWSISLDSTFKGGRHIGIYNDHPPPSTGALTGGGGGGMHPNIFEERYHIVPRRLFITALQWLAIAQGPKISQKNEL